jgi:GAF domain-containing protein
MGPVKEPITSEQQLVILGQVLQTLREADDTNVLINATLEYFKARFYGEYEMIWLGLYDRLDHRIHGKGGFTPTEMNPEGLKQKILLTSGDLLEQVVIQQRPLALADLRQEMRAGDWRRLAEKHGIQGTMVFPICHRGRTLGVAILGSRRWGTFPSADEKAFLTMVLGELGASLDNIETEWLRQQIKRPDKPLISLLDRLRALEHLGQRLEAVVEETHRFVAPARTSVYWFEPKQRYFWRRVGNQTKTSVLTDTSTPASGITAQEINSFYQSLVNDQVVAIGEAHSSLKADATTRLMQLIKARSLLAAPILYQKELLGFLAVEGTEPRIWQEEEKQYVRAAAQMVALAAPLEGTEAMMQQMQLDYALTSEIAQSLYSKNDWRETVTKAATLVAKRLKTTRFAVVLHDIDKNSLDVCYQSHPKNRRTLPSVLPALSTMDWQMVEQSQPVTTLENLEDDLRLGSWRSALLDVGIKSLMVCSTAPGNSLEGLVLICDDKPRSWTAAESNLMQLISQQLGLILHQWQLQKRQEQQNSLQAALRQNTLAMQQQTQLAALESMALNALTKLTESPLAALVSWTAGDRLAPVGLATTLNDKRFGLNGKEKVSVYGDPLLQGVLNERGIVLIDATEIPGESRQWFNFQGPGQILAITLRTAPDEEPTGLLLVADTGDRRWSERHRSALETLANQLAWCRRSLKLAAKLKTSRSLLEQLSWYKQRSLEDVYRTTQMGLQKLVEIAQPSKDALASTRQQQIVRYMGDALLPIGQLVESEDWQFQFKREPMPLIGLVRRSLERADGVIKQRQLWSQVHNDDNPMIVGDAFKFEMILHEVLLAAALRSAPGGRLDLWCRQSEGRWIEVAITDHGSVEPRLLDELSGQRPVDPLAPSTLDGAPGLHLFVCKTLMKQMGADFSLLQLEDGRVMSRLLFPSAQTAR